jgi:hypothetical protein
MGPAKDGVQWRTLVLTTLNFRFLLTHCDLLMKRQQLSGCIVLSDPSCVAQSYDNAGYLLLLFLGPAGTPPIALQPSRPFVL